MLNRDEVRKLMKNISAGKISAKKALSCYRAGLAPSELEISRDYQAEKIAVVGVSGRFPEAGTIDDFWTNLESAQDSVRELSKERFDINPYYDPDPKAPNKSLGKWGGQLSDIDQFDPLFFNISSVQAEYMEPRQRLFLEETWKALEDACMSDRYLRGRKCAVFAGCEGSTDYFQNMKAERNGQYFLGHSNSILAARISYFADLKGPSVTVDTGCSSSLVAVHLACESLRNGDCEIAIAGGVQLMTQPNGYVLLSKAGMLSPTGKCRTFDDEADGMVPGEAVGVVILKRLSDAVISGDHIYGVIMGSGINQDGKTNGITAPSSMSQIQLECDVYEKFGINPEFITYVETHGTGTPLGDPIEIEALQNAFEKYTPKKCYCAIGSVKTNIGHAFAASGITGLVKTLLCIKHKKIPPLLHFSKPNHHIDFGNNPFFVNTVLMDWNVPENSSRIAAINSFGHSGTNCHMVIGEYIPKERSVAQSRPSYLMVFSAKTKEALQRIFIDFRAWLETGGASHTMGDIAYSLLAGRSFFPFRYALVVDNIPELKQKIKKAGEDDPELFHCISQPKINMDPERGKILCEELRNDNHWPAELYKEKLMVLAGLFTGGYDIPFEDLYKNCGYMNISLPKYPFARDRYWLAKNPELNTDNPYSTEMLHPLVGKNISTFTECKFSTRFTGAEYFLKNHRIHGKMVLPGAALIEMAVAAVSNADQTKSWRTIRNIKWLHPIEFEKFPLDVTVELQKSGNEHVLFEISYETNGVKKEAARGEIQSCPGPRDGISPIEEIMRRCCSTFEGDRCYSLLDSLGADLGQSFRGLKRIWTNPGEAIGKIELPLELTGRKESFLLHPVLLDGALQTVLAFSLVNGISGPSNQFDAKTGLSLYVPYSLGCLTIYDAIPKQCYAYVVNCDKFPNNILPNPTFNLLILSETGDIIAKIEGYTLARFVVTAHRDQPISNEIIKFYHSIWTQEPLDFEAPADRKIHPSLFKGNTLIFDTDESVYRSLEKLLDKEDHVQLVLVKPGHGFHRVADAIYEVNPGSQADFAVLIEACQGINFQVKNVIYLWPFRMNNEPDADPAKTLQGTYLSVFLLCQSLMKFQNPTDLHLLYIYQNTGAQRQIFDGGMSGFARTLNRENPAYSMKTIGITHSLETIHGDSPLIHSLLKELNNNSESSEIRYDRETRYIKTFLAIGKEQGPFPKGQEAGVFFRDTGVYIITGGFGGIGFSIAQYLSNHHKARLILTGRSELSPEMNHKLKELSGKGNEVLYIKADCAVRQELESLLQTAREHFGGINGIIHTAGIVCDSFILNKTLADISAVFAPKVFGTLNLDQVFQVVELDFFIMFSSIASVFGNMGQSDYAFANGFMDAFADYRERLRLQGKRYGKTLSVNWPYWENGGMPVGSLFIQWMRERFGIIALQNDAGIHALQTAMTQNANQIVVLPFLKGQEKDPFAPPITANGNQDQTLPQDWQSEGLLEERTEQFLKELIAAQTKIPITRLNGEEPFENYGIDSMMITQLNYELEKIIPGLSKTLFFEYKNLKTLTGYFIGHHAAELTKRWINNRANPGSEIHQLAGWVSKDNHSVLPEEPLVHPGTPAEMIKMDQFSDEIAIIGVSGRYPMADDLEEFWDNLKDGKDCITEIPKERWDHSIFYDPDKEKRGSVYSKWGGFINGVAEFDPVFFKMSPYEAELIDPQERLFLQCAYHTLEDAGYTAASLGSKRVGVYVGVMYGQYQLYGVGNSINEYQPLSSSYASIANRVSYFFDFHGPSMALDSMCSSSLTAIHTACNSIRNGDCDLAIAGGVNVTIHPAKHVLLCAQKFAASDGRCHSFGDGGDGYVPGEGVGAILLKPLSKAKRDKDNIYAIIKSTAINHCGKTNGYTVPDPNLQGELIAESLRKGSVLPESIGYIEAHGTGTSLGDPIEISGLTKAFERFFPLSADNKGFCPIGSVKSNIGHLESAAGIAGITKVLFMMKHKKLVPSIHAERLNPNINFNNSYFYLQSALEDWKKKEGYDEEGIFQKCPYRAGVSSFGAGGANAHVILEEYEVFDDLTQDRQSDSYLIILSAMNQEQLKQKADALVNFLENRWNNPLLTLKNIAFTLQVGREAMKYRLAIIVSGINETIDLLRQYRNNPTVTSKKMFVGGPAENSFSVHNDHVGEMSPEQEIQSLLTTGDLMGLAQVWVSGSNINWEALHHSTIHPQRVSLPIYPFLKKKCWYNSFVPVSQNETMKSPTHSSLAVGVDWERLANEYNGSEVTWTIIDDSSALIRIQDKINRNMFTKEIVAGLMAAFKAIRGNDAVKVAVVTGYDNIFCMGGTQESLMAIAEKQARFTDIPFLYKGFLECDIPVITAMQGHAFGGGLLFGLYGDMVVMAEEGLYCASFMNFGFTPGMGATFILEEKLGGIASEMMFTGKTYRGEEIKRRGGSSVIFTPRENVLNEALNLAGSLAKKSAPALRVLKKQIAGKILAGLEEVLQEELQMHELTFRGAEVKQKINRHFGNSIDTGSRKSR